MPVVTDKQMKREWWKEAQRNARMKAKPVTDVLRQIHDIEQRTGMRLPNKQMAEIMSDTATYSKLPTQEARDQHRENFDDVKADLIKEWGNQLGMKWPTYECDVYSRRGNVYLHAGDNYNAHEIRPNAYGGPLKWWNLVPVNRSKHQSGIHTKGSVHYQAYPDLYKHKGRKRKK